MANLNFFRNWVRNRMEDAERISAEETPYKPTLRLELPSLDPQGEKPRYGFWSAVVFLALLAFPAWGAAVGYFIFADFYDGSRAKALGVAAGMTFTPAIVYLSIILVGGLLLLSRRD